MIIIDIGANLGANAKAAVWWKKKKEREREDYWQRRSLDEIAMSDGQGLKQAQKSVISCFQRYSRDCTTASTVNDRGLILTLMTVMFHVSPLFWGFQDVWIQNNPNLDCCLPCVGAHGGGLEPVPAAYRRKRGTPPNEPPAHHSWAFGVPVPCIRVPGLCPDGVPARLLLPAYLSAFGARTKHPLVLSPVSYSPSYHRLK